MYLKKLILRGFKSFSDKIELEFSPGITVIVGPNGGGKSNLMDALRFCLGEQSSRILRANKTEEFIFNGSKFRKPLGMAEASVLFDNSQKILPLEFEEVLITRQIFREGYNQHFINKTSCRLRDIQELLMGTGIGQGGLCFLSQNEVEKVLLSSVDRREILEEISATNKYKFKKKESLRKLEQTNNNLIRLKDIILELVEQLKNLEGQLQKFRRYKRSCEKLKELEKIYFTLELKKSEEKYLPLEKEEEEIKLSESRLNLEINQLRDEHQENKSLFLEIERQIELEQHEVNLFYLEAQKQEDFLTLIEERKENISQNLNELKKEEENLKIKIKNNLEKIQFSKDELDLSINEREKLSAYFKEDLEKLTINIEKENLQEEYFKIFQELSYNKTNFLILQNKIKNNQTHLRILTNKQEELTNIRRNKLDRTEKLIKEKEELKKEIVSQEEKLNKVYQEYNLIKSNLALLENKLKIFQEEIVGKNNLFKLKVNFLDILEEEKLLFNKIKFPYGQEKIFKKILKEHLSDLVINSKEEALDLIKKVKEEKKSANLWILNNLNLPSRAHNFEIKHLDIIGWADELVDFSSSPYSLILKYLLKKILILKDLKSAFALKEQFYGEEDILFITLEGEILDSRGFLKIKEESDDFSLQEQKELKEEINKLKEEVKKLENEKTILINKEKDFSKEQEHLQEKESNLKINLENLDKEINELERDLSILNKEILENNQDINNLKEELKKDSTQSNDFEKLLLTSEEKTKGLQDAFLVFKEQKESRDKLIKEREEFKIKIATLKQKENDLKEQNKIFLESQENDQLKVKEIRRQIEVLENKQIENQKNYESVERLILKVKLELEEKEKLKEEKIKEKNNLILSIEKKEKCLENFQKEKEIIQGKFYNLELKKIELENQIRDLKTKLSQLGILQQIESNFIVPENLEKKIQTLKNFINNFGGVNLGAEEDYHNLKERADFLNHQLIDLENAKDSLIRIIKEYDQECMNKFQDVFKQVNQTFPEVFKEIFGGGEAQLILEEEKDPLEAGVEIIVRLPGRKRLQNLSLLSGGEKALTSLAFLFTLLKIKRAPFVILDELDAPLDDFNLEKMIKLLKEYSLHSQFIVITHNRLTMESATEIYGITMEEQGVSKVISFKLDEKNKRKELIYQ